jgi:hypothetical protein
LDGVARRHLGLSLRIAWSNLIACLRICLRGVARHRLLRVGLRIGRRLAGVNLSRVHRGSLGGIAWHRLRIGLSCRVGDGTWRHLVGDSSRDRAHLHWVAHSCRRNTRWHGCGSRGLGTSNGGELGVKANLAG